MPFEGVRVEGLRDLDRAFARFGKAEKKMLRGRLAAAAEPVRDRAQDLAGSEIRNIGPDWQEMKVGVTTKLVYVAPARRRGRNANLARPNFAPLLMSRALSPALEQNKDEVVGLIDDMLGELGEAWAA